MNRSCRKRQFHIWLSGGLLVLLLLVQIGIGFQSASNLRDYFDDTLKEQAEEIKQARITEGNRAEQVMIYFAKQIARVRRGSNGEEIWRLRMVTSLFAVVMLALLLQILTAFLRPKRRYIRKLEEETCDRRSGPMLVWYQHLRDGEKEAGYNFERIV